jgi:transglutaminase-like putative cysteine protease
MLIHLGYELIFDCPAPVPLMVMLYVRPEKAPVLRYAERLFVEPFVPIHEFIDTYGNRVGRLIAPGGRLRFYYDNYALDNGEPEPSIEGAVLHPVEQLPDDCLKFLLPSRYCEVDRMSQMAWDLFGRTPATWERVQAIINWTHSRIAFGYQYASPFKTAFDACCEQRGVCRDYMHLAITLLRAMNIPARYATGYLGDIGVPISPNPMDLSAFLEVYLSGRWWAMDPRNNKQRIGRIKQAHGRDAADVALTTFFGLNFLSKFLVWTDEVKT